MISKDFLKFSRITWDFLRYSRIFQNFQGFHGFSRISQNFHYFLGHPRIFTIFQDFLRLPRILVWLPQIQYIQELAPNGDISSAPRNITVFGFNITHAKFEQIAKFEYSTHAKNNVVQTVAIENEKMYSRVKFEIGSNWGNTDYTCLYRIRVHGTTK